MEKMKIKKKQNLLKISRLYKAHWNTLWKIIGRGMENAVNSPFIILKKRQTNSHWDRYLGMMTAMTQVSVPTTVGGHKI